jgi:hypothetical protein
VQLAERRRDVRDLVAAAVADAEGEVAAREAARALGDLAQRPRDRSIGPFRAAARSLAWARAESTSVFAARSSVSIALPGRRIVSAAAVRSSAVARPPTANDRSVAFRK